MSSIGELIMTIFEVHDAQYDILSPPSPWSVYEILTSGDFIHIYIYLSSIQRHDIVY